MSARANKQQRTSDALTLQAHDSLALRVKAEHIAASYQQPTGRPSRLTEPDTVQELLAAITDGLGREQAAHQAGIAPKTLYNWITQAEQGNEAAQAFLQALQKAESDVERRCTKNILKAGEMPQFWAAGMTYLERKAPDRWGRRMDDSSTPKVVVQIGIRDADVTINTLSPVPRNELTE